MIFIVNIDDPKTWEHSPKDTDKATLDRQKSRDKNPKERSKSRSPNRIPTDNHSPKKEKKGDKVTNEKYKKLKEKYENLVNEYNILKTRGNTGEPLDNDLKSLKNILKNKEEKIAYLIILIKNIKEGENNNNDNYNESYLKMKVDELDKENDALKNKVKKYEEFIKNQKGGEIENNLIELRNSMNNKNNFINDIKNLKKKLLKIVKII